MILSSLLFVLQIGALHCANFRKNLAPTTPDPFEPWTGKWFPKRPSILDRTDFNSIPERIEDLEVEHNVKMGVLNSFCDDGKTNLTVDWDGDLTDYTCLGTRFIPNFKQRPTLESFIIPKTFEAMHECMNISIEYQEDIPTFGTHRALWPRYGEYQFVPRQRWLHTLEHGGIVMLYHPCANKHQVNLLRKLVNKCVYRHVITPSNLLKPEMPLALVAWGQRLQMSYVDSGVVQDFIKSYALRGPERISNDGQYSFGLLEKAMVVSDLEDSELCARL